VRYVLYDHPGPRSRWRNRVLTVVFGLALAALVWFVYHRFDERGQFAEQKWHPFVESKTWTQFILPGLAQTLKAALTAMGLALAFGLIFAVGRLSDHWWIRFPAGVVVEFFRAVPLLLMIFFVFYGLPFLIEGPVPAFWAVVAGLTLYNGSVLAEAFRAGVRAVPSGQSEAAYAIGMRKSQVMRYILVPQAARSMLPVIVSQLVVLLKDTALGYIVAFPELLQRGSELTGNFGNPLAIAIVLAVIYIIINSMLTLLANWLDRRTRRRGVRPTAAGGVPGVGVPTPPVGVPAGGAGAQG
jgi:glutamate transport system permease protein